MFRQAKTSLGECWVVGSMEVVDTVPALLASKLAIFVEPELATLAALSADERQRFWDRRMKALESERTLRMADPSRTVFGPAESTQSAVMRELLEVAL